VSKRCRQRGSADAALRSQARRRQMLRAILGLPALPMGNQAHAQDYPDRVYREAGGDAREAGWRVCSRSATRIPWSAFIWTGRRSTAGASGKDDARKCFPAAILAVERGVWVGGERLQEFPLACGWPNPSKSILNGHKQAVRDLAAANLDMTYRECGTCSCVARPSPGRTNPAWLADRASSGKNGGHPVCDGKSRNREAIADLERRRDSARQRQQFNVAMKQDRRACERRPRWALRMSLSGVE
jgi:hypothetical protein